MKSSLLPLDEALAALLLRAQPITDIETVATADALDRFLAADLLSTLDVPPLDNAEMDGYAVRAADLGSGVALPVAQRVAAGHPGDQLAPGTCARIFTGAPIPAGADAVVMQEQAQVLADGVVFQHVPQPGEWVRRRGEDIRAGAAILLTGTRLGPQHCGLAASVGLATVPVVRRPRVACFFTGDELAMPGEVLRPGAIYNSNRFVLVDLLRRLGCEVTDLGNVADSLSATRAALRAAAAENDLVITSGGVSVGEEDHVRAAVAAEGEIDLWRVAIKPGKPLACGRVRRVDGSSAQFIGLPGNPVSSFVTFALFVRPFVLRLAGATGVAPKAIALRADFDWTAPGARREFLRARINPDGGLELFDHQGSGVLTSLVWADGLVDNPPGQAIARGATVRFLPFSDLTN
jgi:molybdopterin molybdotransferase